MQEIPRVGKDLDLVDKPVGKAFILT